ncbi:hypothetical protein P8A22_29230 [Streptomyces laculatispora]|uniref:Uncharacterized protein n=1 Tax=Streptomyces laculatispora TaxID=887464 RepID=A0ABY9IBW2_9ACTN|nr:hypothetical protein [Streptomyces laculatispora]WLQ43647.1 hypothetical protein P8A22_29230 [Streptomyces laculatispora]
MVRPSVPFHSTTPAMAAEMFGRCRRRARNAWTTSGPWVQRRVRITAEQFTAQPLDPPFIFGRVEPAPWDAVAGDLLVRALVGGSGTDARRSWARVQRIRGDLGPILAGVVHTAGDSVAAVFVMLGTVAVVGAAVAGTLAEETADRPLGESSP